ncbi:MAG: hypothetical protein ACRD5M_11100 [Candidatus Acidiferrales bacterium]
MPAPSNEKRFTGFRNPYLYTSILLVGALFYVGWVFTARRQEAREMEQRAKEQQKAEAARTYEMLGGNRFEILNFYAVPGVIHRGDSAQLCYGVSNAKTVKLEPQTSVVWPSLSRCVEVAPKKDTTYTLTAEDGQGNSRTSILTVQVR